MTTQPNPGESAAGGERALRELKQLLRFCGERPGAAVCSERMEGASSARHDIRKEIRRRIAALVSAPTSKDGEGGR